MQQFLLRLLTTLFFLSFAFTAEAATETYTLDPGHSYVLWHINHFGFSNPSGKWMAEGTITVDEAKPQNAKVNVTIAIGDMITGIPKLDEHLQRCGLF